MNEVKKQPLHEAANCLTPALRLAIDRLPEQTARAAEELRLRVGQPPALYGGGCEVALPGEALLTAADLREIVSRAARDSVHSYADSLRQGFLTLAGGHRIGICGTAKVENGVFEGIRQFSSLNIRVAKPVFGCAREVYEQCCQGTPRSLVILSPPGRGKTTLLRDLIRCASAEGVRVAVADERGELAALRDGSPQFDLGSTADVLELCAKRDAVMHLIKTMSPRVVALDEITSAHDAAAVRYAANCGVEIFATAHALDLSDFRRRAVYKPLLEIFVFAVEIELTAEGERACRVHRLKEGKPC